MTPRETLKKNLRCIRAEQGWSQEQMAFSCGVVRSTYSGWENTSGGIPDVDQLQAIADRFRIGADILLGCDLSLLPVSKRREVLRGAYLARQMGHYIVMAAEGRE
jgi:transcriptional regulator with XRE-family HTH domain